MVEEQTNENGDEIPLSSPENSDSIELWSSEDSDNNNSSNSSELFLSIGHSSSQDQAKTLSDLDLSSQDGGKQGDCDDKKSGKDDLGRKTESVSNSNNEMLPPLAAPEPSNKDSQDDQLEVVQPRDSGPQLRNLLSLSSIESEKNPEVLPQGSHLPKNRRKSKFSKLKTTSKLYNLNSISLYGSCKQSDSEKLSNITEVDNSPDRCDDGKDENSVKNSNSQESSKINNLSDRNSKLSDLLIDEARHENENFAQQEDVMITNAEAGEIKNQHEHTLENFDYMVNGKTKESDRVSAEIESKNSFSPVSEKKFVKNSNSEESSKINNVSDRNSESSDLLIDEARLENENFAQQEDVMITNAEPGEIKNQHEHTLENFDYMVNEKTKESDRVSAEIESKNSSSPVSEKNSVKNITSKRQKRSSAKSKKRIISDYNHDNAGSQQNEENEDKPMTLERSNTLIEGIKNADFFKEWEKNYEDNKNLEKKVVNIEQSERNNEKKEKNVKPLIFNENVSDMNAKSNNCKEIDENKKVDKKHKIKNAKRKFDNIKYGKRTSSIKFDELDPAPCEMVYESLDFMFIGDDTNRDKKNHSNHEYSTMADISYSLNYLNFVNITLYLLETQKKYLDYLSNILTDISILPKSKKLILDSKDNNGDIPHKKSSSSKSVIGAKLNENFKSTSSISNQLIEILPKLIDKFKKKLYILKSHKFVALLKEKLDAADFFSRINEYNLSLIKLTSTMHQDKSVFKFQMNSKMLNKLNETPKFAPNLKHQIHPDHDKGHHSELLKELTRLQFKFALPHSSSHFNILFVHQFLMDNFSVMLKASKDHRGATNASQAFIDTMDKLSDIMKISLFKSTASLNFFIASISGSVTIKGSKTIQNALIFYTFHNLFILDCSKIGNIFDTTGEKGKKVGNYLGKLVMCETFAHLNEPYMPSIETDNRVSLKKQADIISQFYRTTNQQIKLAKYLEISEITRKFENRFEVIDENSNSYEFTIKCSQRSDLDLLVNTIKFHKAHNTKTLFKKSELESCAKHFIPISLEYSTLRHFHKLKRLISNSKGVGCHTESDMQGWLRVRIYPVHKSMAKVLDLDSSQYKCCLVNRFLTDRIQVSNCIDLPEKSKKSAIYSLQSFFINFDNENHLFLRVFESTENNAIDFPIDFKTVTPFSPMKFQVAAEANEYKNFVMRLQITYYPSAMIEPTEAKETEKNQQQETNQKQDLKLRQRKFEKDNIRSSKANLHILHSILLHIENEPGTEFIYRRATNSKQELAAIKKVFDGKAIDLDAMYNLPPEGVAYTLMDYLYQFNVFCFTSESVRSDLLEQHRLLVANKAEHGPCTDKDPEDDHKTPCMAAEIISHLHPHSVVPTIMMMQHLSRILEHKDSNHMSCQDLINCVSPAFLFDPDSSDKSHRTSKNVFKNFLSSSIAFGRNSGENKLKNAKDLSKSDLSSKLISSETNALFTECLISEFKSFSPHKKFLKAIRSSVAQIE